MIKHHIEQIRRNHRRHPSPSAAPALRPAASGIGQLSPRELRNEVLALLG